MPDRISSEDIALGLLVCAISSIGAFLWLTHGAGLGFVENGWAPIYLVFASAAQGAFAIALWTVSLGPGENTAPPSRPLRIRAPALGGALAFEGALLIAFTVRYPMVEYIDCGGLEPCIISHTTGLFWVAVAMVAVGTLLGFIRRANARGVRGAAVTRRYRFSCHRCSHLTQT